MKIEKITNEKWLNLYKINGWISASRKNLTEDNFKEQVDKTDALVIVPVKDYSKVVLIEQWREPIQNYEISFPAGLFEENDTLKTAIKRELKEETGLDLVDIIDISPQLFSSSGLTDESVKIVTVNCSGTISLEFQEKDEKITNIYEIEQDEVNSFINKIKNSGKVFGAKAYLILCLFGITVFDD